MKNGIIMLCMLNDSYAVGACMCAFMHKSFIKTNNLNIELVVMCDAYIYDKYKRMLKFYFDKVHKIELLEYKVKRRRQVSDTYNRKYSGWLSYSINKWQCLKYAEYNKVLFMDVDILPMNIKFYDIFNFNTPAFHLLQLNNKYTYKNCVNNDKLYDLLNKFKTYDDYIINSEKSNYRLNGGMALFTPGIEIYNDFVKFLKSIDNNGILTMSCSGFDETTMFYFTVKHQKNPFYRLCIEYMTTPWNDKLLDNYLDKNKPIYAANYLSYVKPWRKPLFISFSEEYIWRKLYHKMRKSRLFKQLYKQTMINGANEYLEFDNASRKYYYGTNIDITYDITYENIVKHEDKIKSYGYLNKQDIKQILKNIKAYRA